MCEHNLQRFRVRIRRRENVVTVHAEEEMVEGGLSVLDLESAVLNGEILERQRDPVTREWKYVVRAQVSMAPARVSLESWALRAISL